MLLRVENLCTRFGCDERRAPAVDGVSLAIDRAETLALVGESGCGKSLTALSILRLVPSAARIVRGAMHFDGTDLLRIDEHRMRKLRGDRIAIIFQEPMTCLNPVRTVGEQIGESLRLHRGMHRKQAAERSVELLRSVGIPAAAARARSYPHELSGGMRQRVMIAMALACNPDLLIADEPTTALDVTIQAQILELLRASQRENGMAILFITHDLGVVAQFADRVSVMYAGRIVEAAPVERIFAAPQHPYTQALLRSTPRLRAAGVPAETATTGGTRTRLHVIPGEVPRLEARPRGCAFHPRCELGRDDAQCRSETPPLRETQAAHACACWKAAIESAPAPSA